MGKKVSIISGTYNEQENIMPQYERVCAAIAQFPQYQYEFIYIDNCSEDKTPEILRSIAASDKRVKVILNSNNYGPNRSGLFAHMFVTGDCMIIIASDLEDPPELIPSFLEKWAQGHKVVAAVKRGSKEFFIKRLFRSLYYKILSKISNVKQIKGFTGFGLYDMSIVKPLRDYYDATTYIRGLISEYGYDIAYIEFDKPVRTSGKSSYNFFSYFDYAMIGITSYSKVPLRIATLAGLFLSGFCFLVAVIYFILKLVFWSHIPFGIAPLIIGFFFFSSVQLLFIGIIGEYIAATLAKVSPKPLVLAKEFINFEDDEIKIKENDI